MGWFTFKRVTFYFFVAYVVVTGYAAYQLLMQKHDTGFDRDVAPTAGRGELYQTMGEFIKGGIYAALIYTTFSNFLLQRRNLWAIRVHDFSSG
jgi:hypothetical protein